MPAPSQTPTSAVLICAETDPEALDNLVDDVRARQEPIWYLAYGSNLSSSVFQQRRGIRPLAKRNVLVKSLELAFDLPGLPYLEPRFANSRWLPDLPPHRHPHSLEHADSTLERDSKAEKSEEEVGGGFGGLIGVAYLVTPKDFAEILKTEGGGASYDVIATTAEILKNGDTGAGGTQTEETFEVITLCAPPSYSRAANGYPSLRYMTIIRDGAREHGLPQEYITYLDNLPQYTAATARQKIGRALFVSLWAPVLLIMVALGWLSSSMSKDGKMGKWLATLQFQVSQMMWANYDQVWSRAFGDGEANT